MYWLSRMKRKDFDNDEYVGIVDCKDSRVIEVTAKN